MSSLYFSWSFLISGCRRAIDCIDLNCLSVSGSSASRTIRVSAMIAHPQPSPTDSWKNTRIASKKSISGWKTLAKTNIGSGV